MQVNEGHAPPGFWARAIISERRSRCHQLLILRQIFKASDAMQYKNNRKGPAHRADPFPQASIVDYFLVEVFFFLAGAFFFSGGGSSAVAEAV